MALRSNNQLFSWVLLFFLAVVWGLSFLFIKKIVVTLTPIELGAGRVFTAAIFLLPWLVRGFRIIPGASLGWITASGLLGNLLPAFLFSTVGSKLNSSLAGTLNSTTSIFVILIGAAFFSARVTRNQLLGIALGFSGSLLLVFSGNDGQLDLANPYALLAMTATIMYGFNVNIVSKYLKGIPALELTSVAFGIVGAVALIVLLFTDFFSKILAEQNREVLYYLLALAAVNTSLALVLFNYLLQITGAVFASTVTYLIPVVAMIAGVLDGEKISFWHLAGMGIILAGVYIINKRTVFKHSESMLREK